MAIPNIATRAITARYQFHGGHLNSLALGRTRLDAVGTLTVNGACPFAGTFSVDTDVAHEPAPGTAPVHATPTLPAKLFIEVMSRLKVAVAPFVTVWLLPPTVGGFGQKSVAVPDSITVCGLSVALSVSVSVALFDPVVEPHCAPDAGAAGANVMGSVQVPPAGIATVQLFFIVKSAVSVTLAPLTVNAPVPVFFTVTATGAPGVAPAN